jgi:hypothetical protein
VQTRTPAFAGTMVAAVIALVTVTRVLVLTLGTAG